jgi:hypothetical protein
MRGNGKKLFPGKNTSNIFFVEDKAKKNLNLNKYLNKTNDPNKTSKKETKKPEEKKTYIRLSIKRNLKIEQSGQKQTNIPKMRHKSVEKFNSSAINRYQNSTLKREKVKPFRSQNSVDSLKIKRVLGNFSSREYFLNKSKIYRNNKSIDNKLNKSMDDIDNKKLNTNKLTKKKKVEIPHIKNDAQTKKLKKFVNKNDEGEKNRKKFDKKAPIIPPKEQSFIIQKINQDGNIIDINDIKKKFSENGINIISIKDISNSLISTNKDQVQISINSKDINSYKFKNVEKIIKNKGLKLDEVKNNYNKKYTKGIFPAKSKWNDKKYGGREVFEKTEMSEKFKKDEQANKFKKKTILTKNNFYKDVKYKNIIESKPKRYNSTEK